MRRIALLVAALCACWLVPVVAGGANVMPPLLILGPVLWAAVHGGLRWGLPTALLAALVSGPLTPGETASATSQRASEWFIRGAVFLGAAAIVSVERRRAAGRRQAD